MNTLITGKPGSGKSLLAVEMILDNSKADSIRPCFSNIDGLDFKALKCFPLEEPDKWHLLPEGSLIIIDEAQDWMPPRPSGKPVPEHVDQLNKHRHQGFDIVLMTPDPMLLDVTARKTVGRHLHCYRPFGMEHRKVFEWNGCNDSPEPNKNESNALVTKKPFDKSLFAYYKSAQVHTHKRRIPWKPFLTIGGAILFFGLMVFNFLSPKVSMISEANASEAPQDSQVDIPSSAKVATQPINQVPETVTNQQQTLFYRGYQKNGSELTLLLEDSLTGEYFDLPDFEGYRKEGLDVVFYIADTSGEFTYRVRDRELLSLLP